MERRTLQMSSSLKTLLLRHCSHESVKPGLDRNYFVGTVATNRFLSGQLFQYKIAFRLRHC